jgi:hypothetical protein
VRRRSERAIVPWDDCGTSLRCRRGSGRRPRLRHTWPQAKRSTRGPAATIQPRTRSLPIVPTVYAPRATVLRRSEARRRATDSPERRWRRADRVRAVGLLPAAERPTVHPSSSAAAPGSGSRGATSFRGYETRSSDSSARVIGVSGVRQRGLRRVSRPDDALDTAGRLEPNRLGPPRS